MRTTPSKTENTRIEKEDSVDVRIPIISDMLRPYSGISQYLYGYTS